MAQGVEGRQAEVLARLESGPRTLRQLALLLDVTEEVVHEPVTELCRRRLVERQGWWYVLTAEGREALGAGPRVGQQVEELADVEVRLGRVAHPQVAVDAVAVAAADSLALDVAGVREVGDDPLNRALGDADASGDVAQPDLGLAGDADQHLRMVGEERPPPSVGPRARLSILHCGHNLRVLSFA